MPTFDPADRRSYRLTGPEILAMWGLSHDLLSLVEEGLAGAVREGRSPSAEHARAEFLRRQARAKGIQLDRLGFAMARPLREADRLLLADRMLLEEGELAAEPEPVSLYEVSALLERTRCAMGADRRALVRGAKDRDRCFALMGMASPSIRPTVRTLRGVLHSAWRKDSVQQADVLAARWPDAIAGRK